MPAVELAAEPPIGPTGVLPGTVEPDCKLLPTLPLEPGMIVVEMIPRVDSAPGAPWELLLVEPLPSRVVPSPGPDWPEFWARAGVAVTASNRPIPARKVLVGMNISVL